MDESQNSNKADRPWLFKKGQSGNPGGRPKGKSLKDYTREMLAAMTDEEREAFLEGIDKKTIWEMGEGKAKQDVGLSNPDGSPLQVVVMNYANNPAPQIQPSPIPDTTTPSTG